MPASAKIADLDGDGVVTKEEVLHGVYVEDVKLGGLKRVVKHVSVPTVQRLPPTDAQMLSLNKEQSTKADPMHFSSRYQSWRGYNLQIASFAVCLRFVFTLWALVSDVSIRVEKASPGYRDCKGALIYYACECGSTADRRRLSEEGEVELPECLFGEPHPERCALDPDDGGVLYDGPASRVPTELTSDELALVQQVGMCAPTFGVKPTVAFPLLPDHIATATIWVTYIEIIKLSINFMAQLMSIAALVQASRWWANYERSKGALTLAFMLTMGTPFFLALAVPMRSGYDPASLTTNLCTDVTNYLKDADGEWLNGLRLGDQSVFCAKKPQDWKAAVELAIENSGLISSFNASLGRSVCDSSSSIRTQCAVQCSGCFGDVSRTVNGETINAARNPCLEYLTFDRICKGRDAVFSLEADLYDYESDANAVKLTGGYLDPTSMCNSITFDDCEQVCDQTFPTAEPFDGTQSCTAACSDVYMVNMLGSTIMGANFVPALCASASLFDKVSQIGNLDEIWEAVELGIGIVIMLSTIVTLAPATLSIILGLLKATKVLKASLPWVRYPAYQAGISTIIIVPLFGSFLAGIFQLAGNGYSLGFSLCMLASFASVWPTTYFTSAKSWADNQKEDKARAKFKSAMILIAIVFIVLWVVRSERVMNLLSDSGAMKIYGILDDPASLVNSPRAPVIVVLTMILDFFGKSLVAKIFFADFLLNICINTELQDVSPQQRIMCEEVAALRSGARRRVV